LIGVREALSTHKYVGQQLAEQMAGAEEEFFDNYLTLLKEKLTAGGCQVETELCAGTPADEILRVITRRDPALLVMSTHGRSGLNRWRYGSVASRLVREAPIATLVIGPHVLELPEQEAAIRRILVPLDGSALAEAALEPATTLARALDAQLVLARAVQWASQVYPSFDPIRLNQELDDSAAAYLDEVRKRTERPAQTDVLRGYPADALIQCVAKAHIDLVVMTSHGRSGAARAILGSVADRMLQCPAPVLLVRPSPGQSASRAAKAAVEAGSPGGPYCQSCGMPLSGPEDFGTTVEGLRQNDYCHFCFDHGRFTQPDISLSSMIEHTTPLTAQATGMSEHEARALLERTLPRLKRWRTPASV
jgi:nucleotide-binding universal stress UspA family protein